MPAPLLLQLLTSTDRRGDAPALTNARGHSVSHRALGERTRRAIGLLRARGLRAGDRLAVLASLDADVIALVLGALACGVVPLVADPGLGVLRMLRLLDSERPRACVAAAPVLHAARWLGFLRNAHVRLERGALTRLLQSAPLADVEEQPGDALALLAFTSGATGLPKPIGSTHATLTAQTAALRAVAQLGPGDVQLALIPTTALLGVLVGAETVLPPTAPLGLAPARWLALMHERRVSHGFGSPRVWGALLRAAERAGQQLPQLRRVLLGGAPTQRALVERFARVAPNADVVIVYGATEVSPVAVLDGAALLAEPETPAVSAAGTLVGHVVDGLELRIDEEHRIAVRGAHVATPGPDGFHLVGDSGTLDARGRLWLWGRTSDVITTPNGPLYPDRIEPIFRAIDGVKEAALVRVHGAPAVVLQPTSVWTLLSPTAARELRERALAVAASDERTCAIRTVLLRHTLPRDARHRAKLLRRELGRWAERQRSPT